MKCKYRGKKHEVILLTPAKNRTVDGNCSTLFYSLRHKYSKKSQVDYLWILLKNCIDGSNYNFKAVLCSSTPICRRTSSQPFAGQVWPRSHTSSSDLHGCTGNSWRREIWSSPSRSVSVCVCVGGPVCVIIPPGVKPLSVFLCCLFVCVCVFL